jgi:thioredoxin 1
MDLKQYNAPPVKVGEADFRSQVLKSRQPVLVAFLAPWSRPCQVLATVLEEVATAYGEEVKVVKVNADDNPDLSLWYEIQSIPTLLYFVKGTLRARLVGTASKEAILAKFDTCLKGNGTITAENERTTR